MVESTALEMRHTGNRIVGSNPTLSAINLGHCSPVPASLGFCRKCQADCSGKGNSVMDNGGYIALCGVRCTVALGKHFREKTEAHA